MYFPRDGQDQKSSRKTVALHDLCVKILEKDPNNPHIPGITGKNFLHLLPTLEFYSIIANCLLHNIDLGIVKTIFIDLIDKKVRNNVIKLSKDIHLPTEIFAHSNDMDLKNKKLKGVDWR